MISLSAAQAKTKRNAAINFPRDAHGRLIAAMPDDTMTGEIECRNKIIIDNRPHKFLEDGIFAFLIDGIFMVKRLQFLPDGVLVLPNNKNYQNWKIELSDKCELLIIGRVVLSLSERTH
ncbi:hypothetical protein A9993_02200 [Rahnella victoriana]|uniref:S24 family peptidase n=1 Tax=Rahnella victoriana TaxID=1510570 RepID=UPI000BB1A899|nr:S24 family peptidase [Rahnella victoriana]PBI78600.1 hypothetical protein A9993_02200 [Rahnella victoriana]